MSQSSWKKIFLNTPKFVDTNAYRALVEKAKKPFQIKVSENMTSSRFEKYTTKEIEGYRLIYGFERIDDETLHLLLQLAEERHVIDQMKSMQEGDLVNWIEGFKSESRAVLHTAIRGITDEKAESAKKVFLDGVEERKKLKKLMAELDRDSEFDTMLFIGIGGSELGPHAICEAIQPSWKKNRKVFYAGNVDPDELTAILHRIIPKKTVVVIVSKSGTTLETATNEARVREFFEAQGLDSRNHFIAITCPKTPMDDLKRYRAALHLFESVGGRYSTTSMVGAILLSFMAGYEVYEEFLEGAHMIDRHVVEALPKDNIPLLMALIGVWNRNFLHYPTVAVIPYSSALHRFPAHLQQCDMESNGKSVLRDGTRVSYATGAVIWGEPGTNAQHSFFQLLHQGTDIIPVECIGFLESQYGADFEFLGTTSHEKLLANMAAQVIALAMGQESENPNKCFEGNRPSLILLGQKITPRALGALLAIYEHKIAFQGFLWGINSFDQEGVQLGKVMAEKLLRQLSSTKEDEPLNDAEKFLFGVLL